MTTYEANTALELGTSLATVLIMMDVTPNEIEDDFNIEDDDFDIDEDDLEMGFDPYEGGYTFDC